MTRMYGRRKCQARIRLLLFKRNFPTARIPLYCTVKEIRMEQDKMEQDKMEQDKMEQDKMEQDIMEQDKPIFLWL